MTRPYLHAPLPRFLRRIFRTPHALLGLIYTPWSLAARETLIADLLHAVENMQEMSDALETVRAENCLLRHQLTEIETQRQIALGEMPGVNILA